jgi:hypothetical protein
MSVGAGVGGMGLLTGAVAGGIYQDVDNGGSGGSGAGAGLFGSLAWSQEDLLRSAYGTGTLGGHRRGLGNAVQLIVAPADLAEDRASIVLQQEHSLVSGLRPLRDKYLLAVLSRMSAPILQMFPELEGYTAAVPSKRDLQALVRAVQGEMVTALLEADAALVVLVCREFYKVIERHSLIDCTY